MLICYLIDSCGEIAGVLGHDLTFCATRDTATIVKLSFYKDKKHLFDTEITSGAGTLNKGDHLRIKFDSGIAFYYLLIKAQEPFPGVYNTLQIWRAIRTITEGIRHDERKARDEFRTWNKQIYEVLFDEKQQSIPSGDSGLLVQRDRWKSMDRVQVLENNRPKTARDPEPFSPTTVLDKKPAWRR